MGVAHQLTTNGSISIVTTSYFVENLQDLFDLPITRKLEFEWLQSDFLKWTGRILKRIKTFDTVLRMTQQVQCSNGPPVLRLTSQTNQK